MDDEQCVQVFARLQDDASGTLDEQARLTSLQEELEAIVERAGVGELDGDEWGEGFCRIFFYGPSATAIIAAIRDRIERACLPAGSYIIQRNGPPGTQEQIVKLP
jgi:hypothetical protein